jgi:hypothetical protein
MSRYIALLRRQYRHPLACRLWGHTISWADCRCERCYLPVWLWPLHRGGVVGWIVSTIKRE